MRYVSTRAADPSKTYSFKDALELGYAPDGGLFVPAAPLPPFQSAQLKAWVESSVAWVDVAVAVLRKFIGRDEIPDAALLQICEAAVAGYEDPRDPFPVVRLPAGAAASAAPLLLAELFHGPTFCFKDLGQQLTIRLLAFFQTQDTLFEHEHRPFEGDGDVSATVKLPITAFVSTTGDTGPAALQAAADADCSNLRVIVAHPEGQVSELQRRQMTTVASSSVRTVLFQGGGDDLDGPIKELTCGDSEGAKKLREKTKLVGLNSFNIGRPAAQVCHYFWTYLNAARDQLGRGTLPTIDFAVPSGALGNLTAGLFAKLLGLPIGRLISGTNVNDVTCRAFTGEGEFRRSPDMHRNLAEAMNIQVPYNFERLLYYSLLAASDSPQQFDLRNRVFTASSGAATAQAAYVKASPAASPVRAAPAAGAVAAGAVAGAASASTSASATTSATASTDDEEAKRPSDAPKNAAEIGHTIQRLMAKLGVDGFYDIPPSAFAHLQRVFGASYRVEDATILKTIERFAPDYVLCPHSACGVVAAEAAGRADTPILVLATASWCKFSEVIEQAVKKPELPMAAQLLMSREEHPYSLRLCAHPTGTLSEAQTIWTDALRELVERM